MSILGVPAAAPSISGRPETLEARNGGAAGLFRWPEPLEIGKLDPALLLSTPVNVAGPPIRSSMALAGTCQAPWRSRQVPCNEMLANRQDFTAWTSTSLITRLRTRGWLAELPTPSRKTLLPGRGSLAILIGTGQCLPLRGWLAAPPRRKMPWKSTSIEVRWQSDARPAGNSTEAPWHRPRGRLQTRPEVRWENERGALAILARCAGKKHPLSHCT